MMMTHTYARTDVLGMHLHRVVSSFPRRPSCVRFPILALIDLPRLGNSYGTIAEMPPMLVVIFYSQIVDPPHALFVCALLPVMLTDLGSPHSTNTDLSFLTLHTVIVLCSAHRSMNPRTLHSHIDPPPHPSNMRTSPSLSDGGRGDPGVQGELSEACKNSPLITFLPDSGLGVEH
eukprot:138316-Rhodomonas_salina.2